MEEGIKSLISCKMRRDGNHQFRIDNRKYRESQCASEADFFFCFFIGHHAPRVSFRTCSCSGRNSNYGQCLGYRTSFTAACRDVIPVISVVAGHDGNGFRRVNAASAAKSNDEIAFLFTTDRCSFHYVRFNRVGQNLVIDNRFRIVFLQQFNDFVEVAVFLHGGS